MCEAHNTIVQQLGAPEVLVYNAGPGMMSWPPPGILDINPEAFQQGFASGCTGGLIWAQQANLHLIPSHNAFLCGNETTQTHHNGSAFYTNPSVRALNTRVELTFPFQWQHNLAPVPCLADIQRHGWLPQPKETGFAIGAGHNTPCFNTHHSSK